MKLNKRISRGLVLSLFISNLNSLAFANSEISNRYETLEGKEIVIDNYVEGELEEIEIFGNTVQDPNDLNNVQSVGDLYIDNNGNPILDEQGRKQYKIDIYSSNNAVKPVQDGLVSWVDARDGKIGDTVWHDRTGNNNNFVLKGFDYDGTNGFYQDRLKLTNQKNLKVESSEYIRILEGESYSLEMFFDGYLINYLIGLQNSGSSIGKGSFICSFGSTTNYRVAYDGLEITVDGNFNQEKNHVVLIKDADAKKIRVFLNGSLLYERNIVDGDNGTNQKVQLGSHGGCLLVSNIDIYSHRRYDRVLTEEEIMKNYNYEKLIRGESSSLGEKITVLLPVQLQKVGEVADKLYWDNSEGRYIVEKNIDSISMDISSYKDSIIRDYNFENDGTNKFYISNFFANKGFKAYDILSSGILSVSYYEMQDIENKKVCMSNSTVGSFNIRVPKTIDSIDKLVDFVSDLNIVAYLPLKTPNFISTNITSKIKVPTYQNRTYICSDSKYEANPTLRVTIKCLSQIAEDAILEAENNSTSNNISLARMYINMLPESLYKDQLQEQLNQMFSSDITLSRETVSANLDVYIKSSNMLSLSLDTNSITFDGYSGVEDMEILGAINLTINSSLPYSLNAYMPSEIANSDKSNTLPIDILNIRESSESTYQQFTDTINKVVLKSDCAKGNGNIHNIDLKLQSDSAHKADVYKTTVKFQVEQK